MTSRKMNVIASNLCRLGDTILKQSDIDMDIETRLDWILDIEMKSCRKYTILDSKLWKHGDITVKEKYTRTPQTVHNTPVMNILKGFFYITLF